MTDCKTCGHANWAHDENMTGQCHYTKYGIGDVCQCEKFIEPITG